MNCPSCGTANSPEASFCSSCGEALSRACSNCGAALAVDARFCHACGQPVDQPSATEERKIVTVLFSDVTGSTALGERLDPERLREVMSAYFDAMRTEIEAEGGTVEKFIGDAVMAVFGVPTAHEDDPARAIRAASRMGERLGRLNEDLARRYSLTLEMRTGINTGEVLAVSEPRPGEGMVAGDAVNVAARLEQTAEPGQVLVGERTARAARGFRFTDVGGLAIKGKALPVRALRLVGEELAPERGIPGLRAPMVGRDRELDVLASLFGRVAEEGRPHLVTIYGDPGVGKSRLTAEFIGWTETLDSRPTVVRGRCLPYGEGITYWPLGEILKGLAGVLDTDPPDVALEKIRKISADLITQEMAPDPRKAAAALAYTVGVDDPEVALRELSPRQVQSEVHGAWRSFFSALAQDAPVTVVVEDIHWADPAMLDLLEDLSERVQGPALFVCPSRPELTDRRPSWGGGRRNFSSVFLEPLSQADAERLIGLLLAVEDLPDEVRRRILERAEGNPFFLEEIVLQLIDEGRIERQGERWRAVAGIEDVAIPDTIQGVLAARMDLLSAEDKRVAQAAAVVGRVFWPGPVVGLLDQSPDAVEEALERLEARELVHQRLGSSMAGEAEYIFKHILVRDVAYESLPRRERGRAHGRVARWIEEALGERQREFAELLAYHYVEAHRGATEDPAADLAAVEDLRSAAFRHLLSASEDARSKMALSKARGLGEQAVGLAASPGERAGSLEAVGLGYLLDYRGTDAWQNLRDAAEAAVQVEPPDRDLIARICSRAIEVPTRWPGSMRARPPEEEARSILGKGLEAAPEGDNTHRVRLLMAESLWPFGFPDQAGNAEGWERAHRAGEQAASMARRLGDAGLEAAALDGYASYFYVLGRTADQWEPLERRLQLVDQLGDPLEVGDVFAMVSENRDKLGRYREAFEYADEGYRRTIEQMPAPALHCVSYRCLARFRLGDWDGALQDLAVAEVLLGDRRLTPPYFTLHAFGSGLFIHLSRGEVGPTNRIREVFRTVLEGGGRPSQNLLAALVLCEARRGDFTASRRHLSDPAWGETYHAGRVTLYENRALVLAWENAWDEVPAFLETARAFAAAGGTEGLLRSLDRLEGRAAAAGGDHRKAVELLDGSRRRFLDAGARWEAAVASLWLAESLSATGDRAGALTRLEPARETFEGLRSLPELTEASRLVEQLT